MIAPARRAAYQALRAVFQEGMDLPAALARERDALADARDRALTGEVVIGVLRWRAALDFMIARLARRPLARLDPEVLDILRLGIYQLWRLERLPPSAVVNDAVELTRAARRGRASALVNAALRGFLRTSPEVLLPAADRSATYLATALSHPQWLVERWLSRYEYESVERWLRFNNSAAPLTLRVNTAAVTVDALRGALAGAGIDTERARYAPDALVVTRGNPLGSELFAAGAFVVQDEASQLVAHMAGARHGARVLDACASPGGKTLVLANQLGSGFLVAADVRPRRVSLLADTLRRTHTSAHVVQMDLRRPAPFGPAFDCVLVDAPCSGLGVVRRDPDIKWRRSPDELAAFAATQRELLRNAAGAVRPGGHIVYATCSSEPEENDQVADRFVAECGGEFEEADRTLLASFGQWRFLEPVCDARGRLRTLPHDHGLEAFFAAVLVKAKAL